MAVDALWDTAVKVKESVNEVLAPDHVIAMKYLQIYNVAVICTVPIISRIACEFDKEEKLPNINTRIRHCAPERPYWGDIIATMFIVHSVLPSLLYMFRGESSLQKQIMPWQIVQKVIENPEFPSSEIVTSFASVVVTILVGRLFLKSGILFALTQALVAAISILWIGSYIQTRSCFVFYSLMLVLVINYLYIIKHFRTQRRIQTLIKT